jgi:hypothetical protein
LALHDLGSDGDVGRLPGIVLSAGSRGHRIGLRLPVRYAKQHLWMAAATPRPRSRRDIEARFDAILACTQSRDEVDRWALQTMTDHVDVDVADEMWWALNTLAGIDLRHGPDEPYLQDYEQVRG